MISVCIFGSQARNTADRLSDRDVLVIGDRSLPLERAIDHWAAENWNVSVFNREAFARIAEVRSLFVQHIKQEGRIVRDDGDFLAATLEDYSPKREYQGERNDAFRQIAELPPLRGNYWYDLCLADATYVLLRNALILHLACRREYCFQYDQLVRDVGEEFGLGQTERLHLLTLRDLKHGYRQRDLGCTPEASLDFAREVIGSIARSIPDLRPSSIARGDTTADYYHLRLLELDLIGRYGVPYLDELGPGDDLYDVWQRIAGAGGYPKERIRLN